MKAAITTLSGKLCHQQQVLPLVENVDYHRQLKNDTDRLGSRTLFARAAQQPRLPLPPAAAAEEQMAGTGCVGEHFLCSSSGYGNNEKA